MIQAAWRMDARLFPRCAECGRRCINRWRTTTLRHRVEGEMVRAARVHWRCMATFLAGPRGAVWLRVVESFVAAGARVRIT